VLERGHLGKSPSGVSIWKTDRFLGVWGTIHKARALETDRYHVVVTNPEDARIAALAAEQFHEHGITATGVDALSRAAGISKRTLYERFGSKDGLIVAAYDALDEPVFEMFTKSAEARSEDPRDQLEAFFGQLESLVKLPNFRGCPFANASSELADPAHPAHEVVRRHKERIRKWLRSRAKAAGATDPELLSRELMLVFAGVQSQALLDRSVRPARDAVIVARALIDDAIPT
jgi:AcrR family transcriptional regulator